MSRVLWVKWVRRENGDLVGSIDDVIERNQGAERYRATAHNGRMGFFASVEEAEQFILALAS
jgi:hypothetical protein